MPLTKTIVDVQHRSSEESCVNFGLRASGNGLSTAYSMFLD